MSSLISESPLLFSPQLAATIGLEEAILLQVLSDAAKLQESDPHAIPVSCLEAKLVFWSLQDLQRVAKSLADKGVIECLSPPLTQASALLFRFDSKARQKKTGPLPALVRQPQAGANRISPHWKPDATVLAQLAQHNIPEPFIRQQLTGFVTYWLDRNEISHSWSARFLEHVMHKWQRSKADMSFPHTDTTPANIGQDWIPSPDALEILQRNGINIRFIEDAVPEFVLYWRERGNVTSTWNSKFIQHVKRQWARYTSALKHDTEPRRIPANWQPSPEVFEILAMANIDAGFAENCLHEFVLYWKDSNQMHSSWNTKFLQHVKYCWANQHQMQRLSHEGQQNSSGTNAGTAGSFIAKHTDRSWREGI